jgi:hypothetical protein
MNLHPIPLEITTREAIAHGQAEGYALWVLLKQESDRDGFWLKPLVWEGPGEYQHVAFLDSGKHGFVKITDKSLPCTNPFTKQVTT